MANLPTPFSRHSLAFRLSLIIVGLELIIFLVVGLVYTHIYETHTDDELRKRLQAVSSLVSRGAIAYDVLNDKELLSHLVGKGFKEAMIVSFTGVVYHATEHSNLGKHIRDIENIHMEWFGQAREGGFVRDYREHGRDMLISVFPVRNAADGAAFVFTYLSVDKKVATAESREFLLVLLLGSAVGVIITSLAIILSFRRLVFSKLMMSADVLRRITSGELNARVPQAAQNSQDELGFMARSLNEMTESMERNVKHLETEIQNRIQAEAALSRAKEELEERVRQRTQDLDRTNRELMHEIEERTMAETALRENHERLQGILEHSPSAISLVDENGRFIVANRQFLRLFASETVNVRGMQRAALLGDENTKTMRVLEEEALASRSPVADEESIILDGEVRTYMTTAFPLLDDSGYAFATCAIRTDVSDKKRLEAESLRTGQLAALGELAAGVAHEINNPLNGIVNYAEIIHEDSDTGAVKNFSGKIIQEGERVNRIVSKLLAFARSQSDTVEPVNVREIVDDALQLLESRIRRDNVSVEVLVDDSVPYINARAHEMRQVLLNLMTNSLHALSHQSARKQRILRIAADAVERDGGSFVDIRIFDNGQGIADSIKNRILTPFFSTKPNNEGTGLGLSISHSIVKAHSGKLVIESEEHVFTQVTVSIPEYSHESFS
eukprot:TRINITY_DN6103_c0_g3_i2.p3 TRINITY_DN6103_c0_g3~~TRINITY_DN6103_c0_g3_i2.p3  ORF type:complete len:671 (-),score=158.67 TRINITY_DN6103_c0_g3_i2:2870-4882(-)